jgi:endothelin-converting enzyme
MSPLLLAGHGSIKCFHGFFARKFVTDVLTEEARDRGEEIAWQMVETFAENLDALNWLDDETRLAAKKKLRHIHVKIGYPQWIMQDEFLTRQYGYALAFSESMTWAEIDDIAGRSQVQAIMSGVAKPRNWESFWLHTPDVFNMMYNQLANDIIGLAAFMQTPQYDGEMPMFFNFGFYGAIIGHELTHGFDSNGAERGPFGDKTDWWTSSSRGKFEASKSCFDRQYSSYPIHGDRGAGHLGQFPNGTEVGIDRTELHDNGAKCLSENIADSGGLGLAAMAYQRWQERHGVDTGLSIGGKVFTAEQLFFIRYGAGWCDLVSTEDLQARIDNVGEPHSVRRLRVVGAVQNSRAFSKAFQCPLTNSSGMNPGNKCELWGIDASLPIGDWSNQTAGVKSFKSSATSVHGAASIVIALAVLFK